MLALLLALLIALAGLPAAVAQDQPIDFDLRTWTQEGPAEWGDWEVSDDGLEVIQTINHSPTFFVSPDTFASASIDGVFEVQTSSDDDYIGFVLGYQGPRSPDTTGYDFLIFNWKQNAQSHAGCAAEEGMSLLRVVGQEDADADYTPSGDAHPALWCHSQQELDDRGYDMDVDVLDTRWGENTGWEDETEYRFTLHYTPSNVRIEIDGQTVFDVDGTFPEGAFGFYNYSQSDVRYSGFTATDAPEDNDPADRPAPGDPGVSRIGADATTPGDVREIAIETCQVVRPDPGSAAQVLISRDDAFADALAGSALLNFDSCILFTEGGPDATLDPRVRAEIDRVLTDNGQVSLLGGTNAVSQAVEDELSAAGHDPQRFAGETRYETAVQIARVAQALQADGSAFEAVLAYGEDWPDAVTAGAYAAATGTPVVLTPTGQLHPETRAFLEGGPPIDRTWVIGGDTVISDATAQDAPNPVRVAGPNRMATAAAIAEQMWPEVPASGEDFIFVNLEHPQGWTLALGAAPLAALLSAPELGVRSGSLPSESETYLQAQGFTDLPAAVLLGDLSFISSQVEDEVGTVIQPGQSPDDGTPGQLAARVTVTTDRNTMTAGGLAQITATVQDNQLQPVPGADVRFEVTDNSGAMVGEGTETTDASGEAVFTYGTDQVGETTITGCTLPDGTAPGSCADTTSERRDSTVIVWESEGV
ncbi:MAG: cell wall-binding repeat-containing protein [Euzebya sp.]